MCKRIVPKRVHGTTAFSKPDKVVQIFLYMGKGKAAVLFLVPALLPSITKALQLFQNPIAPATDEAA